MYADTAMLVTYWCCWQVLYVDEYLMSTTSVLGDSDVGDFMTVKVWRGSWQNHYVDYFFKEKI